MNPLKQYLQWVHNWVYPAFIGGLIKSAIGSFAGRAVGKFGDKIFGNPQDEFNDFSAAQSQAQMNFQERMSNTAHQRQVKDLRAAGLNPILSAKYGGASTPSGAQPSTLQTPAQTQNSATAARQVRLQEAKLSAEIDNIEAQTDNLKSSSALSTRQKEKITYEINNLMADTFSKNESGHLAARMADLRRIDGIVRNLDVKEKEYLLEQLEMDMKILRNDKGNIIKKLRLLKGVNTAAAIATGANETKNQILKFYESIKKSVVKHSHNSEQRRGETGLEYLKRTGK